MTSQLIRAIVEDRGKLEALNAELQRLVPTDPRLNPQQIYVLGRLRERGDRGIHTFELRQEYIANPSQRINELRAYGYTIPEPDCREKLNGRARGVRYRLTAEPELDLVCDVGTAGVDDHDVPERSGGLTDPAGTAASDWEAAGGHHLVHAADPPSEQDRAAVVRVDGPVDPSSSPPGVGGQLLLGVFDDTVVVHATRPHWMGDAA